MSTFFKTMSPLECVTETSFANLHLLASHPSLEEMEQRLESRYKMFKLRDALADLTEFDPIFIDTPPAVDFYTRSALIAGEACLIPFDCDDFSKRALMALLQSIQEVRVDHNPHLQVGGIIINQFQSRAKLPHQTVEALIAEDLPVLPAYLSQSVKIRESHETSTPLAFFDPKHKLALEFDALYNALDGRLT